MKMLKYAPTERVTCPKCGHVNVAEDMSVQYFYNEVLSEVDDGILRLYCKLCGFKTDRHPLDYEGGN